MTSYSIESLFEYFDVEPDLKDKFLDALEAARYYFSFASHESQYSLELAMRKFEAIRKTHISSGQELPRDITSLEGLSLHQTPITFRVPAIGEKQVSTKRIHADEGRKKDHDKIIKEKQRAALSPAK